jgi:hypothetical protein
MIYCVYCCIAYCAILQYKGSGGVNTLHLVFLGFWTSSALWYHEQNSTSLSETVCYVLNVRDRIKTSNLVIPDIKKVKPPVIGRGGL